MKLEQLGSLQAVYLRGNPENPCVVLCHGYGADAFDLANLAEMFGLKDWNFVFPQGHLEVPIGFHMMGRAWFNINFDELERKLRFEDFDNHKNDRPKGLDRASEHLNSLLKQLPFAPEKLFLGGFSQGAMLATEVALSLPMNLAGLIILSGSTLDYQIWKQKARNHKGLRYFQSHGRGDPVLPSHVADPVTELLDEAGCVGQMHSFRGGHEIPRDVIRELSSFLAAAN